MDQCFSALFFSLRRNNHTTSRFVYLEYDICFRIDNAWVFARCTCDKYHIRTGFANFVDRCCGTRNCLTPYNRLNIRVGCHSYGIRNQCFCFRSKVIRICRCNDHIAVFFLHLCSLSNFFITLRCCTGNDTDFVIPSFCCGFCGCFACFCSFLCFCRFFITTARSQ